MTESINNTIHNIHNDVFFEFAGKKFTVKFDVNGNYGHFSSDKYQTFLEFVQIKNVPQLPIEQAIFNLFSQVPSYILNEIVEIIQNPDNKLVCIRMRRYTDEIMKVNLEISYKTGWYYYITGNSLDIPYDMSLDFKKIIKNKIPKILFDDLKDKEITPNDLVITTLVDSQPYHCIEIKILEHTILLDCGFVIHDGDSKSKFEYTQKLLRIQDYLKKKPIEYVFVTHVHDDHSSGLKWLLENDKGLTGILATKTTLMSIRNKFQNDKICHNFLSHAYPVSYEQRIALSKNCKIIMYPAGHTPGNASIVIEIIQKIPKISNDDKSKKKQNEWIFLYSGDFLLDNPPPIEGFDYTLGKLKKKNKISLALLDGSRQNRNITPLKDQIHALYQESENALNKGKSVIIATEPYSLAILIYLYFFDMDKRQNKKVQVPIYVEKLIYEQFCVLKLCAEDLTNNIKSRILGKRNPYESWRIIQLSDNDDKYSIQEALRKPSLILTYPTTINLKPLKNIYNFIDSNSSHLLAFASYLKQPLQTQFNNDPPKCEIFNQKPAYKDYEFQNHGDQSQIDKIQTNLDIESVNLFHLPDFKTFENIHPKDNSN